jgi:hypothetical protein
MTSTYTVNVKHFGEIEFDGTCYALTEPADFTNRAFPGGFNDAAEGDEYLVEYGAQAINEAGDDFYVTWLFPETKGAETDDASTYDWSAVHKVVDR